MLRNTLLSRPLVALFAALVLVLASCGDDDGGIAAAGGGGTALSDEAFCDLVSAIDDDADFDEAEAFALFGDLANRAPDAELAAALRTIGGLADEMSDLDEDDPESMERFFEIMFDPEALESFEVVDAYLTDVCGFDFDDDDFFDDDDDFGAGDTGSSRGSAMDDLDSGMIRDLMQSALDEFAPGRQGDGISISGFTGDALVSLSVYGPDDIDALAVCTSLLAMVQASTSDPEVRVEVDVDDSDSGTALVAQGSPGEGCTEQ